jgi:hypothetical protein
MILLASAGTTAQSAPEDYPQWRGRTRDGSASGFVEPPSWPDTLTKRWQVDVGEGYATPIVIGDTVYAFTRRNGREGITAVDVSTGVVRGGPTTQLRTHLAILRLRTAQDRRPPLYFASGSSSRW